MAEEKWSVRHGLRVAAERAHGGIFGQANDADDREYHALSDVIRAIAGESAWRHNSRETFERVLREAIEQLDCNFPVSGAGYSGAPKKDVALILFGCADEKVTPRPGYEHEQFTYHDYYRAACERIGNHLSTRTYGRAFELIRDDLADILERMAREAAERRQVLERLIALDGSVESSSISTSYAPGVVPAVVRRPLLEQQLVDLLEIGVPIIVVAGAPSVGKRTLVSSVLKLRGGTAIAIDGSSMESAQRSMADLLHELGSSHEQIGPMPQYALKDRLDAESGPDYLIIENAAGSYLAQFFSRNSRVQIIVTTTRRLPEIDRRCYVEVGMLELDEAVELIKQIVPTVLDDDAAHLAHALSFHVLAIVTACGLINQSGQQDTAAFCQGLQREIAEVFDGERDSPLPALTQLYRKTLADLAAANPQALKALELVAYLHNAEAPPAFIVFGLAEALGLDHTNTVLQKAVALRALRALDDRYLISIDEHGYLCMPQLTRTLLAHLIHDHGREVCENLRAGVLKLVALTRAELSSARLQSFIALHSLTLLHLANTYIDPKKQGQLIEYVYIYGQAMHDFLKAINEEPWRVMLVAFEQPEGQWSLMLKVLPVEMKDVKNPRIELGWRDSEPHNFSHTIEHWESRKAMQIVVVERSENGAGLTAHRRRTP
jgi:hypothetical protein